MLDISEVEGLETIKASRDLGGSGRGPHPRGPLGGPILQKPNGLFSWFL